MKIINSVLIWYTFESACTERAPKIQRAFGSDLQRAASVVIDLECMENAGKNFYRDGVSKEVYIAIASPCNVGKLLKYFDEN